MEGSTLKNRNQLCAGCSSVKPPKLNRPVNSSKKLNEAAKSKTADKSSSVMAQLASGGENARIGQCIENVLEGIIDNSVKLNSRKMPVKPKTTGPSSVEPSTSRAFQETPAESGKPKAPQKKKKSKKPKATQQKLEATSTTTTTTKMPSRLLIERPVWKKAEKPTTILIVPTNPGTQVIEELKKAALDPTQLNIKKRKTFRSGTLLLTCATRAYKERMEQEVRGLEVVKPR